MDRRFETGQLETEAKEAGFRAPRRFSHTGTDMAGETTFGAQAYTGLGNGEQSAGTNGTSGYQTHKATENSYHMRKFGYYGVQLSDVARDDEGWRTYEE